VLVGLAVPAALAVLAVLSVAGLAIEPAMAAVTSLEPSLATRIRKMGVSTACNDPTVAAISSASLWQAISRVVPGRACSGDCQAKPRMPGKIIN
jgi:hypothetical protein